MLNRRLLLSRHLESQRANVKLITEPIFLDVSAGFQDPTSSTSLAKASPAIKDENWFSVMKTLVTVQFLQILQSIDV